MFVIMLAVVALVLFVSAVFAALSKKSNSDSFAFLLVIFATLLFGFSLFEASTAKLPHSGCAVGGLGEGTYEAYVVGKHDGYVRVLLDREIPENARNHDQYNTECYLVPKHAFTGKPEYSTSVQTLHVVEGDGYKSVTPEG